MSKNIHARPLLISLFATSMIACTGDPGGVTTGTTGRCERPSAMTDTIVVDPSHIAYGGELDHDGPRFWAYVLEYTAIDSAQELASHRTALENDGWQVVAGLAEDSPVEGWDFLSLLAFRGRDVVYMDGLAASTLGPDGDITIQYGLFPNDIEQTILPALVLPADALIDQVAWTPSVFDFTMTVETSVEYRAFQQTVEQQIAANGLDLSLAYDQPTGLTYFTSDRSLSLSIAPLEGDRLMISVSDRACVEESPPPL